MVDAVLIGLVVTAGLWAAAVGALALGGRRAEARALARFAPDCAVLTARLARDPLVPRRHRAALVLLALYLASPLDLIPDAIPGLGLLDDAVLAALVLRRVVRAAGPGPVLRHWPGPPAGLEAVLRLARAA